MHPRIPPPQHSPTVAEELASVSRSYESAIQSAASRALGLAISSQRAVYRFEDGSSLEFTRNEMKVIIHDHKEPKS